MELDFSKLNNIAHKEAKRNYRELGEENETTEAPTSHEKGVGIYNSIGENKNRPQGTLEGNKAKYKQRYGKVFRAVWDLHEKYYPAGQETDWGSLLREAEAICKRFNNDSFIKDLLVSVITELEKDYEEKAS